MLRPMRPNPLIPTRTAIQLLLKGSKIRRFCRRFARFFAVLGLFHALNE
jgi:hypothetical protein